MKVTFESFQKQLEADGLLYLNVKVIPKAQRTEVVEILKGPEGEEVLKVKVAAVPEKGKANKALCDYLAGVFGVPKSSVTVTQGQTSQRKVIRVDSRPR